jgi:hypothetical protein
VSDATPSESTDAPADPPAGAAIAGRVRRRWALIAVGGALVVAAGAIVAFREPPPPPTGLIVLYGDSLSMEASAPFLDELTHTTGAEVIMRPVPGHSPCDALPTMRDDLALDPTVAVIQYAGNNASDCARGPGGEELTGSALVERTKADVRAATELFATAGTRVVLVGGPDAPGLPGDASLEIAEAYNDIVNEWAGRDLGRVRYADAAATVSGPDHAFAARLPCRADEGPDQGCDGGEVVVRSDDRIHFCPVSHDELVCTVPSPGAQRFGVEMARVVRLALDPDS